jgi:hypothetical protein
MDKIIIPAELEEMLSIANKMGYSELWYKELSKGARA